MDKMNYLESAWEASNETSVPQARAGRCRVFLWRSYLSRGKDYETIVPAKMPVSGQAPLRIFRSRSLEHLERKDEPLRVQSLRNVLFSPSLLWGVCIILPLTIFSIAWFFGPTFYQGKGSERESSAVNEEIVSVKLLSPEEKWQNWKSGLEKSTGYLENNEALVFMLKRYGLSQKQSSDLALSVQNDVDLTKLRMKDPIQLFFDVTGGDTNKQLVGFQIGGKETTVNAYLYQGEPKSEVKYHELVPKTFSAAVTVTRSLYQDGIDNGVPGSILLDMFNRYSFDINFQSDIQRGTRYELAYTMIYNENDQQVGSGNILYANIILTDGRSFPIFGYTDLAGKSQFFNTLGRSINKALLMIPVNGAYVSSTFGYRRDPILGTWRLHRGTDYAAPQGTPIKAGGTGTIITRGWSKIGYGYHIIIRHTNGYDTLYGHMSRFQSGYGVGSKVHQGDIIGYVGSTGKSTGPHVHYEVRRYGKPIDLKSLRLEASRNLEGMDKRLFEFSIRALQARYKGMLPDLADVKLPLDLAQNEKVYDTAEIGVGGAE